MLVATIIGKVLSLYRATSESHFDLDPDLRYQSQPLPLVFGTYRVAGEDSRWIEMELLLRDLKKLEELFHKCRELWREVDLGDDLEIHTAVMNYLSQSLQFTLEVLRTKKKVGLVQKE